MNDVEPREAGLASGVANTSFMMGGALGLAILASVAAARSDSLLASGVNQLTALAGGYHTAFLISTLFAAGAAVLGAVLLRGGTTPAVDARDEAEGERPVPLAEATQRPAG